ncbi:hypothetical protein CRG98_036310 [Punica granatum]|uniref:Uncharacterized protein n=1 Tax=Punica granatum TaxID=22663 RepID=A0A2I0IHY5_PUNGR|nr:hypothetical protein CRG98_036310 [Punica granatum]
MQLRSDLRLNVNPRWRVDYCLESERKGRDPGYLYRSNFLGLDRLESHHGLDLRKAQRPMMHFVDLRPQKTPYFSDSPSPPCMLARPSECALLKNNGVSSSSSRISDAWKGNKFS